MDRYSVRTIGSDSITAALPMRSGDRFSPQARALVAGPRLKQRYETAEREKLLARPSRSCTAACNLEHLRIISDRLARSIELAMDLRFNSCLRSGWTLQGVGNSLIRTDRWASRLNIGLRDDVSLKPPPASGEAEPYCDRVPERYDYACCFSLRP